MTRSADPRGAEPEDTRLRPSDESASKAELLSRAKHRDELAWQHHRVGDYQSSDFHWRAAQSLTELAERMG